MAANKLGSILNIISTAMGFVSNVINVIQEKGDGADNVRLKDVEGWEELKSKKRAYEAFQKFLEKYRDSR